MANTGVHVQTEGADCLLVNLVGELDAGAVEGLEEIFTRAESERRHVLLGLLACQFIDSAGMNALIAGKERLDEAGLDFQAFGASGILRLQVRALLAPAPEPSPRSGSRRMLYRSGVGVL